MSFLYGIILFSAVAVVAPVVIHLVMRSRPRKVTLPTLRFVKLSRQANQSKLRLKHILLLAMRCGIIGLLALLLAEPYIPEFSAQLAPRQPVAMVVVLDTSASMNYRLKGRPLARQGRDVAASIVRELPEGSRVAVLDSQAASQPLGFVVDRNIAARRIIDFPVSYGNQPLTASISAAHSMLQKNTLADKRILIVTDNTKPAWRNVLPLADKMVQVTVVDVGIRRPANVAMGNLSLSSGLIPLGMDVELEATLASENVSGDVTIELFLKGKPVTMRGVRLRAGETQTVRLAIRPTQPGWQQGRICIKDPDGLADDNVRYFSFQVAKPRTIGFVISKSMQDDPTARMMPLAVVPPVSKALGGFKKESIAPKEISANKLSKYLVVVILSTSELKKTHWKALETYVRTGGKLWFVAGNGLDVTGCNSTAAQAIFPCFLDGIQQLRRPLQLERPDVSLPLFRPFADEKNPSLEELEFYRRFVIKNLSSDTVVIARFKDSKESILSRKIEKGEVVFWNFSPSREWSSLYRMAEQFIILCRQTRDGLMFAERNSLDFGFDQPVEIPVPRDMSRPMVGYRLPGSSAWLRLSQSATGRQLQLTATTPGVGMVRFSQDNVTARKGFAVNIEADESDLTRVEPETLQAEFCDSVRVIRGSEDEWTQQQAAKQPLDLLPAVLMLLLLLIAGESFFANRFYRTTEYE